MFYAIMYDLSRSKKDHTAFFEKIKTLGAWMHYMDDIWVISTKSYSTAHAISTVLEPDFDKENGYLLVTRIEPSDRQGWLPAEAWEWFGKNGS